MLHNVPKSKIPKILKIQNHQNHQNPKSPKSKIQNPQNPKSPKSKIQNPQNPKSKIQNPQNPKSKLFWPDFGDFGFWILDRYVAILYVRPPTPQILDFGGGFWILDLGILDFGFWGFWILDFGAGIPHPKFPNPKSKIQTFLAKFWGFWILDRYVAILYVRPPTPQILDFGGDFGFWILDFGDFGFWVLGILDFGFWGFWILDFRDFGDFGFWILEHYVADLYVQILDFGFWGFWILDFGDFGFWISGILGILDFGFWRFLEFGGLGILDLDFVTNFGCYIREEDCARRPGSADFFVFVAALTAQTLEDVLLAKWWDEFDRPQDWSINCQCPRENSAKSPRSISCRILQNIPGWWGYGSWLQEWQDMESTATGARAEDLNLQRLDGQGFQK